MRRSPVLPFWASFRSCFALVIWLHTGQRTLPLDTVPSRGSNPSLMASLTSDSSFNLNPPECSSLCTTGLRATTLFFLFHSQYFPFSGISAPHVGFWQGAVLAQM